MATLLVIQHNSKKKKKKKIVVVILSCVLANTNTYKGHTYTYTQTHL